MSSLMGGATLAKDRHLKYWLRCVRTLLPHYYESNDSSRMSLGFFIVTALDLLDYLDTEVKEKERQGFIDWIYHCQHPAGGFRGFPATDFGSLRSDDSAQWDPVNLPATYFALTTLMILGDDLERVKRQECLSWLPRLQRENGSFGEMVGSDGGVLGGEDLRFCYCATCVRWILGGRGGRNIKDQDIDVTRLLQYINSVETFEGGITDAPYHEAHAGYTYCAIAALALIGRVAQDPDAPSGEGLGFAYSSLKFPEETVKWLLFLQTTMLVDYRKLEESDPSEDSEGTDGSTSEVMDGVWNVDLSTTQKSSTAPSPAELRWAGITGRVNKVADTCYSFWVGGALAILGRQNLIDWEAHRNFLLEKTQHRVGGFGKLYDDPPDVYHGSLGLAALAIWGEPGLKELDPVLCASVSARQHLERLGWWSGEAE